MESRAALHSILALGRGPNSELGGIARQNGAYYHIRMRTISLKLPDDLLARLDHEAKARRVTKSWLVRESLEKALYKASPAGAVSCYDLARDLAGSVRGLPEDLAVNPEYMKGFGQ
jgi:capsid portal protein